MIKKAPSIRLATALFFTLAAVACGGEGGEGGGDAMPDNPLLYPRAPEMNMEAPPTYRARFETSKGDFVVQVHRDWAPMGADRFYNLVRNGYYDDVRFFRVIDGFMAQFGMNADPIVTAQWRVATIQDDPVAQSNTRGRITFAMTGQPNSRTTQVFINFGDNSNLDGMGFAPFGEIVEGMEVVDALYSGYGEGAPRGAGPDQGQVQARGNEYLESDFPNLDYVVRATIE
jgi:peptidyl-prolyl cis-trans isomerase A (cyclophilin A)